MAPVSGHNLVDGISRVFTVRLLVRAIRFIHLVIVARIIKPEDFGIFAIAFTIFTICETFTDYSPGTLLTQVHSNDIEDKYKSVFTIAIVRSLIITVVILIGIYITTSYHGAVGILLFCMCMKSWIVALRNPASFAFLREQDFIRDTKITGIPKVAGCGTSIVVAWYIFHDWRALIAGVLIEECIRTIMSYVMARNMAGFISLRSSDLSLSALSMMGYSGLRFLYERMTFLIIGGFLGSYAVSIFNAACEICMMLVYEISGPVRYVTLPMYAKLYNNRESIEKYFWDIMSILWLFLCPAAVGLSMISSELVWLVLGSQWSDVPPLIDILWIHALIMSLSGMVTVVLLATGRSQTMTIIYSILLLCMGGVMLYVWEDVGLYGISKVMIASDIVLFITLLYAFIHSNCNKVYNVLLSILWRPALASLFMMLIFNLLKPSVSSILGAGYTVLYVVYVIIVVIFSMIVYGTLLYVMWVISGRPHNSAEGMTRRYIIDKFMNLR